MTSRILVACIGNIFLGDDGFGVEVARRLVARRLVARRLVARPLPAGVRVVDFGIRGMDLVYALIEDYDALVFVDAAPRGEPPGTLYLIEPHTEQDGEVTLATHGIDPVKVLKLAWALGAKPIRTYLVACKPAVLGSEDDEDVLVELSAPVRAAVNEAVRMVESLPEDIGNAAQIGVTDIIGGKVR